jgi:hypothetical protein
MLISTAIHFKDFHLRPGEICLYSQGLGRSPRKFHVCSEYFVSKLVAANSTVICYLLIHLLVTYMWKASDLDSSFVQILR